MRNHFNPKRAREDSIIVKGMIRADDEREISSWLTRIYKSHNIAERISILRELAQKGLKDPEYISIFKEVMRRGKFIQELQAIEEQFRSDRLRHQNPVIFKDKPFVLHALEKFNIKRVKIAYDDSKAKYPDLWVILNRIPVIVVTDEFLRQNRMEREKRITHEFLHLVGLQHGKIGNLDYNTVPEKDSYSLAIYKKVIGE